jgi:hypothetical protein
MSEEKYTTKNDIFIMLEKHKECLFKEYTQILKDLKEDIEDNTHSINVHLNRIVDSENMINKYEDENKYLGYKYSMLEFLVEQIK